MAIHEEETVNMVLYHWQVTHTKEAKKSNVGEKGGQRRQEVKDEERLRGEQ